MHPVLHPPTSDPLSLFSKNIPPDFNPPLLPPFLSLSSCRPLLFCPPFALLFFFSKLPPVFPPVVLCSSSFLYFSQPGEKMLAESLYPCIMQMVSANVCRALPPATDDFDPEEDEPVLELSWPHLQVRFFFFLLLMRRHGASPETSCRRMRRQICPPTCIECRDFCMKRRPILKGAASLLQTFTRYRVAHPLLVVTACSQ